jgi:ubiquinone/menaquinone biosynthesis C-methylase UbiE
MEKETRICDYEGTDYRADFWEGQGREYEDLAERFALRRLLPAGGRRLLDIGGGFGRLSAFYERFDEVVLLDYSTSLLRQAQDSLGRGERIKYVAASFYAMPFASNTFDAMMMVRVMHHVEDVRSLLQELARCLAGGGLYIAEYASKRHLKAILRYALSRQEWNPFAPEPQELSEMHLNFHPSWMRQRLKEAGFHVKQQRTVSHFRLPLLKRLFPPGLLAALDAVCQPTGAWWQLTPSVFVQCKLDDASNDKIQPLSFRCPACRHLPLEHTHHAVACPSCLRRWPVEDGIYNFKYSLPA